MRVAFFVEPEQLTLAPSFVALPFMVRVNVMR